MTSPIDWISCVDRTPEPEIEVLVVVDDCIRIACLMWESHGIGDNQMQFLYWSNQDDYSVYEHDQVTHWMPLPDYPKIADQSA